MEGVILLSYGFLVECAPFFPRVLQRQVELSGYWEGPSSYLCATNGLAFPIMTADVSSDKIPQPPVSPWHWAAPISISIFSVTTQNYPSMESVTRNCLIVSKCWRIINPPVKYGKRKDGKEYLPELVRIIRKQINHYYFLSRNLG